MTYEAYNKCFFDSLHAVMKEEAKKGEKMKEHEKM
jgi:hypothetical protein